MYLRGDGVLMLILCVSGRGLGVLKMRKKIMLNLSSNSIEGTGDSMSQMSLPRQKSKRFLINSWKKTTRKDNEFTCFLLLFFWPLELQPCSGMTLYTNIYASQTSIINSGG